MGHERAMERFIPQIDAIEKALAGAKTTEPSSDFDLNQDQPKFLPSELRNAAVLIPLLAGPNGLEVIFTKRSTAMRHHPGQISFPGGKQDVTDTSLAHTALREAEEEIGLGQKDVKMIGALPKHITVTSFLVRPYVGLVPDDFKAKLSTGEVSKFLQHP